VAGVSAWPKGLFEPEAVAVIGASDQPGSLGRLFVQNLLATYRGELYLVHPSRKTIANRAAYPSILDIPTVVDLAVVLVPSQAVERVIEQCVAAGVRAAVVISGGFAEIGPEGARLQQHIVDTARSGGLRLVGPNCFGIINTRNGLNASLGQGLPGAGGVSLVTQSGAYGMAAFTRSREGDIGFAKVLALGNRADVDEVESLHYLGDDAETRVVAMLLEALGDGRAFYELACAITPQKPVIVLKTGRTRAAKRAAASHTAALADDYAVTRAALRQAGVRVVEDGQALLDAAAALDRQPPLRGRRVGIITNSGGIGVELTDLIEERGLEVPSLSSEIQARLAAHLPAHGSAINPIDVTTAWQRFPEMYGASARALLGSPEVDAVVAVLVHRAALAVEVGQWLIEEMEQVRRSGCEKPLHICWLAGRDAEPNWQWLVRAGIPCHRSTSSTARILAHCLQSPRPRDVETVAHALSPPRSITEEGWVATDEVYALLCSAELPVVSYRIVGNVKSAGAAASAIGFPVTVKVIRPGLVHKFKAGAVVLNVSEPDTLDETLCRLERKWGPGPYLIQQQASAGVEWLIGAVRDPSYGPVVLFGPGGVWAEALDDVSVRLAPFAVEEGLGMLADIRCQRFFDGLGSFSSVDRHALAALLAKLSHWVSSNPWLAELDLNPVIANEQGLHVVDARMRAVPTDPVS
jgi:acyl-CoA synthetase (NDP forming)